MNETVFQYKDYKTFLRAVAEKGERGILRRMAEAAGCQNSYLSQSLKSHVNLTSDHLCGIAHFLKLSESELEYLLLLLEKEKSLSPSYQIYLDKKINQLQNKSKKISTRVSDTEKKKTRLKYYSAWYYSAVHIASSIESLRVPDDFAKFLGLPKILVSSTLRELEKWGMVQYKGGKWNFVNHSSAHLPDDSELNRMNHLNWRFKSLSTSLNPDEDLHYSSVFTISKEDGEALRNMLMKFIEDQRGLIKKSGTETMYSFCCDFFSLEQKN